jgi:hypothetical protein
MGVFMWWSYALFRVAYVAASPRGRVTVQTPGGVHCNGRRKAQFGVLEPGCRGKPISPQRGDYGPGPSKWGRHLIRVPEVARKMIIDSLYVSFRDSCSSPPTIKHANPRRTSGKVCRSGNPLVTHFMMNESASIFRKASFFHLIRIIPSISCTNLVKSERGRKSGFISGTIPLFIRSGGVMRFYRTKLLYKSEAFSSRNHSSRFVKKLYIGFRESGDIYQRCGPDTSRVEYHFFWLSKEQKKGVFFFPDYFVFRPYEFNIRVRDGIRINRYTSDELVFNHLMYPHTILRPKVENSFPHDLIFFAPDGVNSPDVHRNSVRFSPVAVFLIPPEWYGQTCPCQRPRRELSSVPRDNPLNRERATPRGHARVIIGFLRIERVDLFLGTLFCFMASHEFAVCILYDAPRGILWASFMILDYGIGHFSYSSMSQTATIVPLQRAPPRQSRYPPEGYASSASAWVSKLVPSIVRQGAQTF